jgi:hypothetical protein
MGRRKPRKLWPWLVVHFGLILLVAGLTLRAPLGPHHPNVASAESQGELLHALKGEPAIPPFSSVETDASDCVVTIKAGPGRIALLAIMPGVILISGIGGWMLLLRVPYRFLFQILGACLIGGSLISGMGLAAMGDELVLQPSVRIAFQDNGIELSVRDRKTLHVEQRIPFEADPRVVCYPDTLGRPPRDREARKVALVWTTGTGVEGFLLRELPESKGDWDVDADGFARQLATATGFPCYLQSDRGQPTLITAGKDRKE